MSSLRMTFSLASLIFLIALGLVFVPTAVMAHDSDATAEGIQPEGHVHPMITISSADEGDADTEIGLMFADADTTDTDAFPTQATFEIEVEFDVKVSLGTGAAITPAFVFLAADQSVIAQDGTSLASTLGVVAPRTSIDLDDDDDTATTPAAGKTFTSKVTVTDQRDPDSDGFVPVAYIQVTIPASAGTGFDRFDPADNSLLDTHEVASEETIQILTVTGVGPAAPASLVATAGPESVTLTWTAVSGSKYEYMMSTADMMGTGSWMDVADADAGDLTVSNLTADTEYEFKVRVKATETASAGASASAMATPVAAPVTLESGMAEEGATLDEPFDVTFTFADPVALVMDDISVTDGIAGAPKKADDPNDGTVWIVEVEALATATSITVGINSPLESGTVIAEGADYAAVTLAVPNKPTNVMASANDDENTITITWDAVTGADSYIVKKSYTDPDDATATVTKTVSEDGLTAKTLTIPPAGADPLVQGVEFSFTVIAVNAIGESEASDADTAELEEDPNTPPIFEASDHPTAIDLWAGHDWKPTDATDTTGNILYLPKATDVLGDIITYELMPHQDNLPQGIQLRQNDDQDRWVEANKEITGFATVATPKTTYRYYAVDQHGTRSEPFTFTIEVSAPIVPTAPTNVMADEEGRVANPLARVVNDNKVVTSWDEPVDTSGKGSSHNPLIPFGAPITEYKVQWNVKDMSSEADDHYLVTEADHEAEFTARESTTRGAGTDGGALDIARYEFQVSAMNSVGYGALSEKTEDSEVLVANPPSVPTDLGEGDERVAPTTITLNWLPSTNTGIPRGETAPAYTPMPPGTEIADGATSYYLYQTFNNVRNENPIAAQGTNPVAAPLTDTTHQLTGLNAGDYVFRVVAVNFDGFSAESLHSRHQVLVDPPPSTDRNPPAWRESGAAIASITNAVVDTPIDGVTLPEANADGDAITYSLDPPLSADSGLTFNASTRFLSGTPKKAMSRTAYVYKATSAGGAISLNFEIEVRAKDQPAPVTSVHLTASYANGVTTLSGTLNANSFGTVGADALPNIHRFFAEGGSISVLSSKTGALSKDVVISEIMWGLDLNQGTSQQGNQQFIELYNTTKGAVDLSMVTIEFNSTRTIPAVATGKTLLDQASNVSGAGWLITDAPGSSGRIPTATNTGSANLVSMYRNIDYAKVEKADHNTDAAKNREEQLKGVPNGNVLGGWAASNVIDTYGLNLIGSPRAKHFVAYTPLTASAVDRGQVIINEIGNHSGDQYDWIELRNVSSGEVNLKKWELSQVTDDKKDTQLVSFPDNDNHKIAAGGILLIVNSDPYRDPDHPIAAGTRINTGNPEGTGMTSRYYVDSGLKLKDSGKTLLILRSANDKEGKPEALKDVVGTLSITDNAASLRTSLWPLAATGAAHGNVIDGTDDEDFRAGKVYKRNDAGGGTNEKDLGTVGYTGVGYKRSAAKNNQNGGTPGYANDAVKVNESELAADATVSISEIMYARGNNLPQWIELHNNSMTQAINLSEWKLKIEHSRDVEDVDIRYPAVTTNNFGGGIIIQPNQTVLIVSTTTGRTSRAAQGRVDFPATRVINLWGQKDRLEVVAGMTRRSYKLLSQTAFKLTLMDKSGAAVDVAGNLAADGTALWELPKAGADEGRSSIIRRYDSGDPRDGTMEPSWVLASISPLAYTQQDTFYGSADDISTPGYRGGGALPVSLSKFRPERMKDTGEIVVRWITESELNNAGFNILRSEKRDGEFTKVHFRAGKGTTSERTTYEWKDTSAKPNVVYYYQIQDVSLDGEVTTLRTTHLRGNVTAAGKLTTTWGEIKALQ